MGNEDIEFGPRGWEPNGDWQVNTVAAAGATQALVHADVNDITLTAACTITLPAGVLGRKMRLIVRQDGTGSRIVTWAGPRLWAAGTAPTLSTAASSVDRIDFECVDGTNWYGTVPGKAYA